MNRRTATAALIGAALLAGTTACGGGTGTAEKAAPSASGSAGSSAMRQP